MTSAESREVEMMGLLVWGLALAQAGWTLESVADPDRSKAEAVQQALEKRGHSPKIVEATVTAEEKRVPESQQLTETLFHTELADLEDAEAARTLGQEVANETGVTLDLTSDDASVIVGVTSDSAIRPIRPVAEDSLVGGSTSDDVDEALKGKPVEANPAP